MANDWTQRGWINAEQLTMVQQTLAEAEVKKLIQTWIEVFPFTIGISYFRETGSVGAGLATKSLWSALGTYASTLFVQATVMGAISKRKLRDFPSNKVVPWLYFTPLIGDFAPLLYLSRKHPDFLRLLWAYRISKGVWNKQQTPQTPGRRLQQHLYQRTERQKFEQGLRQMDKILAVTDKVWQRVDKVLNGGKKVFTPPPTP